MLVRFTISVEILTKINYNKIIKDGYQTGGVTIEATDPNETQTVDVRGTKAMRADKKPVKAKWY